MYVLGINMPIFARQNIRYQNW